MHSRDKTDRMSDAPLPRVTVKRGADGGLKLKPDMGEGDEPVRPETIAEERPPQAADPRPVHDRNVGGPYGA